MGTVALEEYELMKDSKYRVYVSAIDKALKNFDYSSEWADLISALGKLNKVLLSNTKFPVIPRRIKICKRLAQCMHPALPFGVHLRALETYDIIFKSMGTNRLSHELFIYSAGLFPLLGPAAMKVRPDLLKLYETHFVPLGHRLRPALPGFLSGVLPGLDESSDHSVRTNALLEKVCDGVGANYFYGCIWDCLATNVTVRLQAISYVYSNFDKKLSTEDQPHIMGTNIETMLCGLIACVQDVSVLVQRCALDLLIVGFPMHNSHITRDDMVRLVTAALSAILRRDSSLNRRLFGWLLGSEVNMTLLSHHPHMRKAKLESRSTSYFEVFSKAMLIEAINITLDNAIGVTPHDLKPYKLLTSLLDKSEIGNVIVGDILYQVFRLLYLCYHSDSKSNTSELPKSANLLFSSLEPRYFPNLWHYTGQLFTNACIRPQTYTDDLENPVKRVECGVPPGIVEVCALVEFLLDVVPIETCPDTPSEHLPTLFLHIVTLLTEHCDTLTAVQTAKGLQLCAKILTRVQPAIVGGAHMSQMETCCASSATTITDPSDSSLQNSLPQDWSIEGSSDWNQNNTADSSSIDERIELPVDASSPPGSEKSNSLFEQCLRQYERFYVNFVYGTRLKVGETKSISLLLECLRFPQKSGISSSEQKLKQVESLLRTVLFEDQNEPDSLDRVHHWVTGNAGREWVEPMKAASKLLVDLSTLQTIIQTHSASNILESDLFGDTVSSAAELLPEWLRVLIVCACWLNRAVPLQLTAISTFLKLVSLCRTAQSIASSTNSEAGVTPVLIMPLLTPTHLNYMEKHTLIFQVIAHWLWSQLEDPEHRVFCVELLHSLQSSLPGAGIVEDSIGHALSPSSDFSPTHKLNAFRRFAIIWHIGRENHAKLGNSLRITDILFKSMLKMLDNLKLPESDCLKTEAQNWLLHSLLQGDIHRILDPILVMLLDPATARLSILHIRIHRQEDNSTTDQQFPTDSSKIYAISSVDGTVIHHMSNNKKGSFQGKRGKRISTVTTITSQDSKSNQKYVTEKKQIEEGQFTYLIQQPKNLNLISVYVNPFSAGGPEINTDFDDYFIEKDSDTNSTKLNGSMIELDKLRSKSNEETNQVGNNNIMRNHSCSTLNQEMSSASVFDVHSSLKLSSLDLLNLSDTIFTRVSEGKAFSSLSRGSYSSSNLTTGKNSELVRSWSFPGKEDNGTELEESTAADEYFSLGSQDSMSVVEEILSELVDSVVILSGGIEEQTPEKPKERRKLQYQPTITPGSSSIDHLHSHILLYCGHYDAEHTLYIFQTLRNIFITNPRIFLSAIATNGLVPRSPLLKLLARHRKSLFGRGFSGDLEPGILRRSMYIEVVLSICLYYIRSYYPNLGEKMLNADDIALNREVQISATEILYLICNEMVTLVRDSGRALACYLAHLFSRLKFYKIILHCTLTSVQPCRAGSGNFTHQVLNFNEGNDSTKDRLSRHSETLQIHFVRLLLSLIILEHEINIRKDDEVSGTEKSGDGTELRYDNGKNIPQQPLFISAISRALELHPYSRHTQSHWTTLITCSLPYLGNALTKVVTTVVKQICNNIEALSKCYTDPASVSFPPDYGITQVEALTILCHYCLLDSPFNQTISFPSSSSSRIFNFSSVVLSLPPIEQNKEKPESHCSARKTVLGNLPRVIASVAVLWQALVNRKDREGENCEVGSPRVVKQQLLEFLSPVAKHHAVSFLAAMAVVWRERRPASTPLTYPITPIVNEDQQVLVQILNGIKAMPIDTLVKTLHQVVKQPAMNQEIAVSVEVSALELFVQYSQLIPGFSLYDSWSSLLPLFKEAPSLSPPAQFLLLGALSQFVHRCPSFTDKRVLKDLQDITAKLLESCTTIAGACLEQTTWLRRNLAVREEDPAVTPDREDKYFENDVETPDNDSSIADESLLEGKPKKARKSKLKRVTKKIRHDAEKLQIRALHQWFMKAFVNETNLPLDLTENTKNGGSSIAQYSVSALTILGQLLAPLFDVVFGSQEKERVVTLLTNLMYNVTPYLKNHTQRNATSYFASSQLLASLSGYQYTRKAWKKDAMDLLLDSTFFQMEPRSIPYWKTIVDNLFSQDAATFRELMGRVSLAQGNSLSIFSSKEQEYEQRAQLLKRLAFVILCSEKDQFHKYLPDIQDRLADCWRLPHVVPILQAQIFLCFRVLLLRMSPHHIVPFWPPIISELVQVLMHMELDLSTDSEEFSSHIRVLSSMDSGWIQNSSNGMQASSNPQWLQLQLAAASFLFLAVQLPADNHPQFQMYRWAFVGGDLTNNLSQGNMPDFIPHVTRIARLMDAKFGSLEALPTPLLPAGGQIRSVEELHPFFTAMSSGRYTPLSLSQLEHNTELDFLDVMPLR